MLFHYFSLYYHIYLFILFLKSKQFFYVVIVPCHLCIFPKSIATVPLVCFPKIVKITKNIYIYICFLLVYELISMYYFMEMNNYHAPKNYINFYTFKLLILSIFFIPLRSIFHHKIFKIKIFNFQSTN